MTKREREKLSEAMRLLLECQTFDEGRRIIEVDLLGRLPSPIEKAKSVPYKEIMKPKVCVWKARDYGHVDCEGVYHSTMTQPVPKECSNCGLPVEVKE